MSQPAPFVNHLHHVFLILETIVGNRLPAGEARKEVIRTLRTVCQTTRMLQANTVSTVTGSVWDKLRSNTTATDFLLDVTFDLTLALAQSDYPMAGLHADVVFATCQFGVHGKEQVIDQELAQRLLPSTGQTDLLKLYTANPWLTVMRLFDMQLNRLLPEEQAR